MQETVCNEWMYSLFHSNRLMTAEEHTIMMSLSALSCLCWHNRAS